MNALKAKEFYRQDVQYIVKNGKALIINEVEITFLCDLVCTKLLIAVFCHFKYFFFLFSLFHYLISHKEIITYTFNYLKLTGRVEEKRRWSEGIHQAVEAKEGLQIQVYSVVYPSSYVSWRIQLFLLHNSSC